MHQHEGGSGLSQGYISNGVIQIRFNKGATIIKQPR